MADQTLMFDLLAKDSASGAFRDMARSALAAAGEMHAAFAEPIDAKIKTEGFDEYMAKLAEMRAANDLAIGDISARTMKLVEGADAAGRELDRMSQRMDEAGASADGAGGRFGRLFGMLRGFGAANGGIGLGVLGGGGAAVALTGVLGLASALTSAAGAAGVLGLAVVGDVKGYAEMQKQITKLQTSLATMSPTSKSYARDQAQLTALLKQQRQQYGPMVTGLAHVSTAWNGFLGKTHGSTMRLIGEALKIAADALRQLAPVANAAAKAMLPLLKNVDQWVKGSGFRQFLDWLKTSGSSALADLTRVVGSAALAFVKLMEAFAPVGAAITDFLAKLPGGAALALVGAAIGGVVVAMTGLTGPVAAAAVGIAAVGAAMLLAWKRSSSFRTVATNAFHDISKALGSLVTAAKAFWSQWGGDITKYGLGVLKAFVTIAGSQLSFVLHLLAALLDVFSGHWKDAWNNVKQAFTAAWNGIKTEASMIGHALLGTLDGVWHLIESAASAAWDGIKNLVSSAWDAITSRVADGVAHVKSFVSSLPGEIVGFFAGLPGQMFSIGANILQGLLNGLKSLGSSLGSTLSSIAGSIPGAFMSALQIKSPSRVMHGVGQNVMQGLINGLRSRQQQLKAELQKTATMIQNSMSWAQSFAGNMFSAGLPTTRSTIRTTTGYVNGIKVVSTAPGQTHLTREQLLAEMFAYETKQARQARQLNAWVTKLSHEGLSRSLLEQMAAGGPQGLAEIAALASATPAQIRRFNHLNASANKNLNNAGAMANTGRSMKALHAQQARQQAMVNAITKALAQATVKVKTVGHHPRLRVTG